MSRHQHGYPWASRANPLYRLSLPVGLQGAADVCRFLVDAAVVCRSQVDAAVVCRSQVDVLAFARPCEEVHRRTSLMSSSLLLQQWPACLVILTWIVFVMGGKWPYSCSIVGCCLVQEIRVQSQVALYQRLNKWYLIPPYVTLSIIRYVSRVKWSNPGEGVAPSPTPRCSYWKGSLLVPLDYGRQLYCTQDLRTKLNKNIYIYIYIYMVYGSVIG